MTNYYTDKQIEELLTIEHEDVDLGCMELMRLAAGFKGVDFDSKVTDAQAKTVTGSGESKTDQMIAFGCQCGQDGDNQNDLKVYAKDLIFVEISDTDLIFCGDDEETHRAMRTTKAIVEAYTDKHLGPLKFGHLHGPGG